MIPQAKAMASPAAARYTRAIVSVKLGERVLGENPELDGLREGEAPTEQDPDPATWRQVDLRMPEGEGWLEISVLRPAEWLEANDVRAGESVALRLPELGTEGEAEVLSIAPCPPIRAGAGHVVTGRFLHHSAHNMLDLRVEGEREPIGVTANHPFWSEDRQAFVPAGELKPGERLRTSDGVSCVISLTECADEAVCNLEVQGQHVYRVAASGILVHNNCGGPKPDEPEDFYNETHGNSRFSPREAILYMLTTAKGKFLKWGVTQDLAKRYPKWFMEGKRLIPKARGPRSDMLDLERRKVETNPGPHNHEPWAGARRR